MKQLRDIYKKKSNCLVLLLIWNLGSCSSKPPERVMLKLNLAKNQVYHYSFSYHQVIEDSLKHEYITNKIVKFGMKLNTTDSKGTMFVQNNLECVQMNSLKDGAYISLFDTDNHQNDSSSILRKFKLKGSLFKTELTSNGAVNKISSIVYPGSEKDSITNDNIDASEDEVYKDELESYLLKQLLNVSFNIYPNKAVGLGDTWQSDASFPFEYVTMKIHSTYKMVSITSDSIFLEVESKIVPLSDTKLISHIEASQRGTIKIDKATGMIVKSRLEQNIDEKILSTGSRYLPLRIKGVTLIEMKN